MHCIIWYDISIFNRIHTYHYLVGIVLYAVECLINLTSAYLRNLCTVAYMYVTERCTPVCLHMFGTWTVGAPEPHIRQIYSNGRKLKQNTFPLCRYERSWHFSERQFKNFMLASRLRSSSEMWTEPFWYLAQTAQAHSPLLSTIVWSTSQSSRRHSSVHRVKLKGKLGRHLEVS